MKLTKEQIELGMSSKCWFEEFSPTLVWELSRTALALYDENERLRDNIDGWKAVMKKTIGVDASDVIKELKAENTKLREAIMKYVIRADKETIGGGHQYTEDFYEELKAALAKVEGK